MIRKFNYTQREKIKRRDTLIAIDCSDSSPELQVNIRIENYREKLPPHGVVYVEAYHRTKYERFRFGTVSQLRTPDDLTLKTFTLADTENVRFRVKVVDETEKHGRIIAMADGTLDRGHVPRAFRWSQVIHKVMKPQNAQKAQNQDLENVAMWGAYHRGHRAHRKNQILNIRLSGRIASACWVLSFKCWKSIGSSVPVNGNCFGIRLVFPRPFPFMRCCEVAVARSFSRWFESNSDLIRLIVWAINRKFIAHKWLKYGL
jgi:hypothetical protein